MLKQSSVPAWFAVAPCRGQDRLFFSAKPSDRKIAVNLCNSQCANKDACLGIALSNSLTVGVWGGKTGPEIERLVTQSGSF